MQTGPRAIPMGPVDTRSASLLFIRVLIAAARSDLKCQTGYWPNCLLIRNAGDATSDVANLPDQWLRDCAEPIPIARWFHAVTHPPCPVDPVDGRRSASRRTLAAKRNPEGRTGALTRQAKGAPLTRFRQDRIQRKPAEIGEMTALSAFRNTVLSGPVPVQLFRVLCAV